MMRSNSFSFCSNSSRIGKTIRLSSRTGVKSSFCGVRRMVKWTRSTAGSLFKQVPPRPLALVGLARDQQHAQPIAHAVDGEQAAVVVEGELVLAGRHLELDDVGAGIADGDRQLDRLADRHVDAAARPRRSTDRVTGAVPPAGSSILNLAVTSRPTTPKRGDCSITISRSRSFFLPAIRAWTGAPPSSGGRFLLDSIAGTSCTWPSVSSTTPASRSGGTSTSAERMVSIRRVPPGRSLPSWMCAGRQHGFADFEAFLLGELPLQRLARGLHLGAALADRHGIGIVDHDQGHVGDRLALLLDQRGVGQRQQHHGERAQPPEGAAGAGAPG